ncbi:hypothetical protein M3B43_05820 [Nesterenkonia massiliensis]|uniref:Uncharacterized protein n=1 Tax=Nesterenkonia massiliensis TaxID=1232429 RepID=A0ABT2HQ81_9MICC|nr:hypothetical protein [Nesterenkonia massiliensis]MCT1606848.1 hypothetical protein [Nesterenkonia massiliensis]
MARSAVSIIITIVIAIVLLWLAITVFEIAAGIAGSVIVGILAVLGVLYLIRALT